MEVAQALIPMAGSVHMFGRGSEIRRSHETHYVGDLRAHRTEIFDQFQLKMGSTYDETLRSFRLMRCVKSKICFTDPNKETLPFIKEGDGTDDLNPFLDLLKKKPK